MSSFRIVNLIPKNENSIEDVENQVMDTEIDLNKTDSNDLNKNQLDLNDLNKFEINENFLKLLEDIVEKILNKKSIKENNNNKSLKLLKKKIVKKNKKTKVKKKVLKNIQNSKNKWVFVK